MARPLIHPKMLAGLKSFFNLTCEIVQRTDTQGTDGALTPSWTTVSGLSRIPANLGEMTEQTVVKSDGTYAVVSHAIMLAGFYPQITEDMQAVADGQTWLIVAVVWDALHTATQLKVRQVRT
jgi:hypothetical protein